MKKKLIYTYNHVTITIIKLWCKIYYNSVFVDNFKLSQEITYWQSLPNAHHSNHVFFFLTDHGKPKLYLFLHRKSYAPLACDVFKKEWCYTVGACEIKVNSAFVLCSNNIIIQWILFCKGFNVPVIKKAFRNNYWKIN